MVTVTYASLKQPFKIIKAILSLQSVGWIWSVGRSLPTLAISSPIISFLCKSVYDELPL